MRVSNWEEALSHYLQDRREMPFEYGVNDCCMFAAGAVEAITGQNPMSDFIGKYKSLASSVRAIKDAGYESIEQIIDERFEEIPVGFASTGDLAFFDGSVGVVLGGRAAFVGEGSFTLIDRHEWTKAWGVARG